MHFNPKFVYILDVDSAMASAELVHDPVTAELGCLMEDNSPDRVTPLIRPELNAKAIPYKIATCGLIFFCVGDDDDDVVCVVSSETFVFAPPLKNSFDVFVFVVGMMVLVDDGITAG